MYEEQETPGRLVGPAAIPADAEENNLRPRSLDEYIGQDKVKENLKMEKCVNS